MRRGEDDAASEIYDVVRKIIKRTKTRGTAAGWSQLCTQAKEEKKHRSWEQHSGCASRGSPCVPAVVGFQAKDCTTSGPGSGPCGGLGDPAFRVLWWAIAMGVDPNNHLVRFVENRVFFSAALSKFEHTTRVIVPFSYGFLRSFRRSEIASNLIFFILDPGSRDRQTGRMYRY